MRRCMHARQGMTRGRPTRPETPVCDESRRVSGIRGWACQDGPCGLDSGFHGPPVIPLMETCTEVPVHKRMCAQPVPDLAVRAGAGIRLTSAPGVARDPLQIVARRCKQCMQSHACAWRPNAQVHNGILVLTVHLVMVMFTVIAWAFLLVVLVLFRVVVYVLVERLLEMRVTSFAAKVTNYLDTIALPIVLALYLMGHGRALGR